MEISRRVAVLQERLWKKISAVLSFFVMLTAMQNAYASGFGIFTQSASSMGQGDAVVAHTDSPSTIFFNPALMNKLDGTQVELGTTLVIPHREFKSDTPGGDSKMKDEVFFPSTFYVTHKFNGKVSAGLAVFNPFGLGTDWGDTWEGNSLATKSEITTFNINPSISFQITPQLFFGAGIDIIVLDTSLSNAGMKFTGDGTAVGYNLGLLFDITKDISIGASYRSEVKVDINGQATFALPILDSAGKTEITLPQQVFAGVSYKGFDPLTLEAGMRWEGWSSFKQLKVDLANGVPLPAQPKDWKDTFALDIGAQYKLNDTVTLLAGYLYGQNPVPDSTFEPALPDSDVHLFCIGTVLNLKRFSLSLAYDYQLPEERTKTTNLYGSTANGKYSSDMHLLAAGLKYKF
jgi:long-chain fatty acid transport protein